MHKIFKRTSMTQLIGCTLLGRGVTICIILDCWESCIGVHIVLLLFVYDRVVGFLRSWIHGLLVLWCCFRYVTLSVKVVINYSGNLRRVEIGALSELQGCIFRFLPWINSFMEVSSTISRSSSFSSSFYDPTILYLPGCGCNSLLPYTALSSVIWSYLPLPQLLPGLQCGS